MTLRRWVAIGAAVVVLVVLLPLYLREGVPIRRGHVAMPPAAAAPADVLRAYFDAVGANDKTTQRTLWAAGRRARLDSDHVWAVTGVHVGQQDPYRPQPDDPDDLSAYRNVVRVLMSFHVRFWLIHDDPQQPTSTFYLLVRNGDRDPWRIWGVGAFI